METLMRNARHGLRIMRRNLGFTGTAVAILALGIGARTAIFTVADDFLFRPLPFPNSDRIVVVKRFDRKLEQSGQTDPPSFKYWRENNRVFEEMGVWSEITQQYNLAGAEGPERVWAKRVSSGFFRVLGVKPVFGQGFLTRTLAGGGPQQPHGLPRQVRSAER
jgi:MacB-like periplasmic core domain